MIRRTDPVHGEVVDLTHKTIPVDAETRDQHIWGDMPPGQGGRHQRSCRKCGQRASVVGLTSLCPGRSSLADGSPDEDYDPF